MDSSVVYKALYQYFINYEYKLFNSFLFDWESDFFAVSKSGYRVEVEVKVSRSDYFKDFEKPKHKLFQAVQGKRSHIVQNRGSSRRVPESLICEYERKVIEFEYGPDGIMNSWGDWQRGKRNGKTGYWVNDYGAARVRKKWVKLYAQATDIRIRAIADILCPNQFYYAVPEGLIKQSELPPYAGLIAIAEDNPYAVLIKKAPYLHKNHPDMTKVLLKKFYNQWKFKVDRDEKLQLSATKTTE